MTIKNNLTPKQIEGAKKFKRFFKHENLIDMDMVEYFSTNSSIEEDFETPAHEFFTRNFGNFSDLNTIIPITKHVEKSQSIVQRFLDVFDYVLLDDAFNYYNNVLIDSLYQIEKNGLHVDFEMFKRKFEKGKIFEFPTLLASFDWPK